METTNKKDQIKLLRMVGWEKNLAEGLYSALQKFLKTQSWFYFMLRIHILNLHFMRHFTVKLFLWLFNDLLILTQTQ